MGAGELAGARRCRTPSSGFIAGSFLSSCSVGTSADLVAPGAPTAGARVQLARLDVLRITAGPALVDSTFELPAQGVVELLVAPLWWAARA